MIEEFSNVLFVYFFCRKKSLEPWNEWPKLKTVLMEK